MTDTDDLNERLPLHPMTFRVLIALSEQPSFGTAIVKHIEEAEPGALLYPANLFRRIRDLLADGWIEECPGPPGADARRTYVRLTEVGRRVARMEARRLDALVSDARHVRLLSDA